MLCHHPPVSSRARAACAAIAAWFLTSLPAHAAPVLNIGPVTVFSGSSSPGNPVGTWTLGDKDWTYVADSGNWSGIEYIQLTENVLPSLRSHQFLVSNLSGYASPLTLSLGYHVHINDADGPGWMFLDVNLGVNTSGATVDVWKDVYGSLADFNAHTGTGTGTLAALHSQNGSLAAAVTFSVGLTDLWIRDTIQLSSPGGQLSSFGNTLRELNVPELNPASCGGAVALLMGSLGLLECSVRRRRPERQNTFGTNRPPRHRFRWSSAATCPVVSRASR
jgi:hypothetical protein